MVLLGLINFIRIFQLDFKFWLFILKSLEIINIIIFSFEFVKHFFKKFHIINWFFVLIFSVYFNFFNEFFCNFTYISNFIFLLMNQNLYFFNLIQQLIIILNFLYFWNFIMLFNLLIELNISLLFHRILTRSYLIFLMFKFKIFLLVNKSLIIEIDPSHRLLCWLIGFLQYSVVSLLFKLNFLGVRAAARYFIFIFCLNILWILNFKLRFVDSSALHYICLAAFKRNAFLKF